MLVPIKLIFHLFVHFIFQFNIIICFPSNVYKFLFFHRLIIVFINYVKRTLNWQIWNTLLFLQMLNRFNLLTLENQICTVIYFRGENTIGFELWFSGWKVNMLVIVLWARIFVVFIVASWVFVVAEVSFYFGFAEGGDGFVGYAFFEIVVTSITGSSLPCLKTRFLFLSQTLHVYQSVNLNRSWVTKLIFVQVSWHFLVS